MRKDTKIPYSIAARCCRGRIGATLIWPTVGEAHPWHSTELLHTLLSFAGFPTSLLANPLEPSSTPCDPTLSTEMSRNELSPSG